MKRRILSIITVLALCLSLCPTWALAAEKENEPVPQAALLKMPLDFTNVGDGEGQTPASGEGYTWDAGTNTLTLNGLNMVIDTKVVTYAKGVITLPGNSTLVLEGTSGITIQEKQAYSSSIRFDEMLTVKGTGTLNLNLNAESNKGIFYFGSDLNSSCLRLESGTVNITASDTVLYTEGIMAGKLELCGAELNIKNTRYAVGNLTGIETIEISGGSLNISHDMTDEDGYGLYLPFYPKSNTSSLSITGGSVDISGVCKAVGFGEGTVTVSGGSLNIHDLVKNDRGYSWALEGTASGAEPQVLLTGGDVNLGECVRCITLNGSPSAGALQIGDECGLSGLISTYRVENDGKINQNEVRIYGDYTLPESMSFSGNQVGIWVIDMAPGSTLTIPEGVEFDMSALNRSYNGLAEGHNKDSVDLSGGRVVNNGTLKLPSTITNEQLAQWAITGDGQILVGSDNVYLINVTGGTADKTCAKAGDTVTLTADPVAGKIFYGWEAPSDVTITDRDNGAYTFTMPGKAVAIAAQYACTVTFDSQSGSAVDSQMILDGQTAAAPADPERENCIFLGWYTDAAGTAPFDFTTPITENLTLYAKWNVLVESISLNQSELSLTTGGTATLTVVFSPADASNQSVSYSSDAPAVATVDESGNVTAVGAGTATITVTTADGGKTAACAVTVTVPVTGVTLDRTAMTLTVGGSERLTATVEPTDATDKSVTWTSGNTDVAAVDESGSVTAVGAGTATITVTTADGGKTAACTVTVTVPATGVTLDRTAMTLTVGGSERLTATVEPADATDKTVTWTSGNTDVATVDESGNVTAVGAGTATITVTTADGGRTAACAVTVTVPATGVTLDRTAMTLTVGGSERLTATVEPADATDKTVTWASGNTDVATVDESGNVTAVGAGTATITVTTTDGGRTAACAVTVTVPATGVTLDKTAMTLTVGGSERLTATVEPADATDKSVTWTSGNTDVATVDESGNVTAVGAGTATITVTTADGGRTAACAVTVSASGSGGGGYVPSNPTPAVTVPVSGDKNTVRVSASVSGSTATVSRIDAAQIDSVIGGSAQMCTVEIDFTGLDKTVDTVKLPADAIAKIAAAAQDKNVGGLTVKLSNSEISFNGDALAAIQAQADSQITLTVTPARAGDLNARQKETVGSAPVYDLALRSDGRSITDFGGGYATVSLPYTLAAGQSPSGVVVYYLDGSGNITPCATTYDVRNQSAIFSTGHLSLYFVGYDPTAVWVNPFSDVAEGAWYYDAVRFVNQNGLMNGYSNGSFGPSDNLSRAMLAQILFNKEGRPVVNYLMQYGDVAEGAWYAEAVRWAASQGIVSGYGSGLFGPDDNITREQLAVMLWRYAGSPAATGKQLDFADADKAGAWAMDALRWAIENGVISGNGSGILDPTGSATRAEAAQMLKNFLEKQ